MDTITSKAPSSFRYLNGLLITLGLAAVIIAVCSGPLTSPVSKGKHPVATVPESPGMETILNAIPAPDPATAQGEALTKAMAAVRQSPDKADAWLTLGDFLAQGQRETADPQFFNLAEQAYQRVLRLKPDQTDAMAGMAWVFGGRHQFDLSILWAEKALMADPDHATAHGIVGDAAVELGDLERAFTEYQKMMDLRPDLSSWSRGAWVLWLSGKTSKSILLMEQAVRSGGPFAENTAWCRARLAMMLFQNGTLQPAMDVLTPALVNNTRNTQVLLAAGRISAAAGDFGKAQEFYETILKSGLNLEALAALGDIAAMQNQPEAAEKFYEQVEALHRTHRETGVHDHMEMARFYADHDRSPEEALSLAVEHGEARNGGEFDTRAWVFFRNGNQEKAIADIKRALKVGTPDAAIQYHAGCIAAAAGDRVSAQKHLQMALSMNSRFSLIHAPMAAQMLEKLGESPPVQAVAGAESEASAEPPGNALMRLR